MKEFLTSTFPYYTEDMYEGNQPSRKGHQLTGGGYADGWNCWYGGGETSGESVLVASIYFNPKVSLFVCGDMLRIIDHRYSGNPATWVYDSRGDFVTDSKRTFPLEVEKIEKILSAKLPGRFWNLVQKRALEIYAEANKKG